MWEFFDPKGTGKLSASDLRKKLLVFYKNITVKEVKFLLNNQPYITFEELYNLLKNNHVSNFDPVREAFRVYDPHDTGFVDVNCLKDFFKQLGYGELSDDDAKILLATADADRDGKINLEDFRQLVPFTHEISHSKDEK